MAATAHIIGFLICIGVAIAIMISMEREYQRDVSDYIRKLDGKDDE